MKEESCAAMPRWRHILMRRRQMDLLWEVARPEAARSQHMLGQVWIRRGRAHGPGVHDTAHVNSEREKVEASLSTGFRIFSCFAVRFFLWPAAQERSEH